MATEGGGLDYMTFGHFNTESVSTKLGVEGVKAVGEGMEMDIAVHSMHENWIGFE